MSNNLEEMSSFFNKRAETYEEHMIMEVDGAKEAYLEIAKYIPVKEKLQFVDLGCGTGLELEAIYKCNPDMKLTGIDLSGQMLDKLFHKYEDKNITLHNMSYFDFNYGSEQYDAAVSCMTLHHFSHEEKIKLYTGLCKGIKMGGRYVECDYMAKDQSEEDFYFAENRRLRKELGITEGFFHYDTPCTVENQISMLLKAGFTNVERVWQMGSTVILVCDKRAKRCCTHF